MTNLSHDSTRVGALDLEVSFQQGVPHLENLENTRSLPGLLALDQGDFAHLDNGILSVLLGARICLGIKHPLHQQKHH